MMVGVRMRSVTFNTEKIREETLAQHPWTGNETEEIEWRKWARPPADAEAVLGLNKASPPITGLIWFMPISVETSHSVLTTVCSNKYMVPACAGTVLPFKNRPVSCGYHFGRPKALPSPLSNC